MGSLRLLLFLLGLAALTAVTVSEEMNVTSTVTTDASTPSACPDAYYEVGGRCVLVNPFLEGTWEEARYYCNTIDSDFVEIDTLQFFLDVLNFLRFKGLDQHSYWLGARDVVEEGTWRWEVGGGVVPMGSPFWALEYDYGDEYFIEPTGKNYSNCLRLDHQRYLYLDDQDCTSVNSLMCQVLLL